MKKVFFAILIIAASANVKAQVMQQKAAWATFTVPQMKCWECKDRLEKHLLRETDTNDDAAVFKVVVNMFNGTVRVQYVPDRITAATLRVSIANAGFDVDSLKAAPESYAKLPPVCKRKEEGGGPQKGVPCNIPPDGQ